MPERAGDPARRVAREKKPSTLNALRKIKVGPNSRGNVESTNLTRELSRSFESTNLSRDNLSREMGRGCRRRDAYCRVRLPLALDSEVLLVRMLLPCAMLWRPEALDCRVTFPPEARSCFFAVTFTRPSNSELL